jgi:hypothetical protein
MVAIKTLYTLASANQKSRHIGGQRCETLYTLTARHENSIYIEPSLGHNGTSASAQKSRTVKRNDTGLQLASQSSFSNTTL